nr:hypothetical protein [Candidatus Sigynarchaeota archaeon]
MTSTPPAEASAPKSEENWQKIGFHRPLAGILFNLVFVFIAAGFGIVFAVWFIPNIVFPFASGLGYQDLVLNLFGLLFTVLDVGIGASISMFVAEENIKNPRKGIFYLQFFIWFQMISGLFQVTGISIWAIFFAPGSNLGYAIWFLVIYGTIQYPGCLWIFNGGLQAYQRFDKARLVGFIQVQLF